MRQCKVIDSVHRLALGLGKAFRVGKLALAHLDTVLLAEPLYGLDVAHALEIHQETQRIAGLAAAEALEDAARAAYRKRRSALIVKRAQPQIRRPAALERHEVAHDVDDIGRVHYPVDGSSVYPGHMQSQR